MFISNQDRTQYLSDKMKKFYADGQEYLEPTLENTMQVLRPGATYKVSGSEFIDWECPNDSSPPTWSEVQTKQSELGVIWKSKIYSRIRQDKFGSIEQQLDQLYNDIDSGKFGEDAKTGSWYVGITSIKQQYSKDLRYPDGIDDNGEFFWNEG